MELDSRGLDILGQADAAFKRKSDLDAFWQATAELHFPERADFTRTMAVGEDMLAKVYTAEPILFRRDFANFIGATMRPKGREWFKLRAREEAVNEVGAVQRYLERRGRMTRNLLYDPKSQFARAVWLADHDWATFGNSVTSVEERRNRKGLRFRTWHLRDCAWRENYDGEVDTLFRRFKIKVRNLVARARISGWKISDKVREKLDKEPDVDVNMYHITMPAIDYNPGKKFRMDWVSVYIDADHKFLCSEKAVPEFNYQVSRWFTIDGSPYAFSPCVLASMPDAATIQSMTWAILEAGEKAVEPPLVATQEAILGGVSIRAGDITWVDRAYDERNGEAIRALELGQMPQVGEQIRQGIISNMNAAWYLNKLFLPQGGPQRTAEEVIRWNEEFLRVSQPIMDPAEAERNGLLLDIVISMALRLGFWGDLQDMPKELRGRDVDVTYDNPIEDARKLSKTQAYRALSELVAIGSQMDPPSTKQIDHKTAFREAVSGIAPPNWLLDENDSETAIADAQENQKVDNAALDVGAIAKIAKDAGMNKPEAMPAQ